MKPHARDQIECPCCKECKDCATDFQKVVDLKDVGLVIYRHTARTEDVDIDTGVVEFATTTTEDVYILHNTKNMKLTSVDYLPEIDRKKINCPRCRRIMEHAQKLLQKVPIINKNDVHGICEHCTTRGAPCSKCKDIVNKFVIGKSKRKMNTKVQVNQWLSKIKLLLKDAMVETETDDNVRVRAKSELYIDQLCREPPKPGSHPNFKAMFYPHWSDFVGVFPRSIEKRKNMFAHFPNLEKLEYPLVFLDSPGEVEKPSTIITKEIKLADKDKHYDIPPVPFHSKEDNKITERDNSNTEFEFILRPKSIYTSEREQEVRKGEINRRRTIDANRGIIPADFASKYQYAEEIALKSNRRTAKGSQSHNIIRNYKSDEALLTKVVGVKEKDFVYVFPKALSPDKILRRQKSSSELIKDTQDMIIAISDKNKIRLEEERKIKMDEEERKRIAREEKRKQIETKKTKDEKKDEEKKYEDKKKETSASTASTKIKVKESRPVSEKKEPKPKEPKSKEPKPKEPKSKEPKPKEPKSKETDKEPAVDKALQAEKAAAKAKKEQEQKEKQERLNEIKAEKEKEREMKLKQMQREKDIKEAEREAKQRSKETKSAETEQAKQKKIATAKDLSVKSLKSNNDLILQLIKLKDNERKRPRSLTDINLTSEDVRTHQGYHKNKPGGDCTMCLDSSIELDAESLLMQNDEVEIADIIMGTKIFKYKPPLVERLDDQEVEPLLFQSTFDAVDVTPEANATLKISGKHFNNLDPTKGVVHYALSDRSFIEKGWTLLPIEKVVKKMNVYRMRPAQPEFDWFEHNKNKRLMTYDTGEKLAEFDDNGRGRWFYKNGRIALDYYDAEELNAQQRFVVYGSGEADEHGRFQPYTLLATFDYLGNGVVFDHSGKIRLKYNQTEGVVLDRSIGPVSHWQWHSLNDPPVLQQVMIDTQMAHKDPSIMNLGGPADNIARSDNEDMLAIEFDNFIKEKSKKLTQSFKSFQIKMKALKINKNFSLKVLDQSTVYLIFRDGTTNMKLNIGMVLDPTEIVDTDTAEVGEVSTNMERLPARTDSLERLQKNIVHAQQFDRTRTKREHKIRPLAPCGSADKLTAAASRPLRLPLRTGPPGSTTTTADCCCKFSRKSTACNVYYSTCIC